MVYYNKTEETNVLSESLESKDAGPIAVYGRRLVGKTFLIHTTSVIG